MFERAKEQTQNDGWTYDYGRMHGQTDRLTNRQTDGQTDRQTDGQTGRLTDRENDGVWKKGET